MRFPDTSLYDLSFPSPPSLRLTRLLLKTPVIRSQTIEIAHRNIIKDPPSRAEMKETAPDTKYPFDPSIAKVPLVAELTVTFEAELGAGNRHGGERSPWRRIRERWTKVGWKCRLGRH